MSLQLSLNATEFLSGGKTRMRFACHESRHQHKQILLHDPWQKYCPIEGFKILSNEAPKSRYLSVINVTSPGCKTMPFFSTSAIITNYCQLLCTTADAIITKNYFLLLLRLLTTTAIMTNALYFLCHGIFVL